MDGWQSLPQARSPTVCLQRESVELGQSKPDPWLGCGWRDRDVENPVDFSASMLPHHLTPSIQLLPWLSSRDRRIERAGIRDASWKEGGGGEEGQDEGGEPGLFPPRASR